MKREEQWGCREDRYLAADNPRDDSSSVIAALSVTIAGMWTHDPWQRRQTTALLLDVELRADERLAYDHAAPVHFGHYWR